MEKPTPQEWKRENPGKNLNDYFQEFPESRTVNSSQESTNFINPNQIIHSRTSKKEIVDIGSIIVSIMILVAFFLPWIDVKILGMFDLVNSNGFDLPKILEKTYQGFPNRTLNTIYVIPVGAFIAMVAETQKSWVKPVAQIVVVFITVYWFLILKQLIYYYGAQLGIQIDPLKFFSFGIYLTVLGCLYYIWDAVNELMKLRG